MILPLTMPMVAIRYSMMDLKPLSPLIISLVAQKTLFLFYPRK
jgi:hypothetical protein